MGRVYVFADESGNFAFNRKPGSTKYFIIVTITLADCACGAALLALRRELAWEAVGLESEFHATTDAQAVRDRVFTTLKGFPFRVDATMLEKAKAQPQLCSSDTRFYQYAWFYHMKYVMRRIVQSQDEALIVGASIGTNRQRSAFRDAINDVIAQVSPTVDHRVASWSADSDPCLQLADYCAWAIQRKWESGDSRSYDLIKDKIATEFNAFRSGTKLYY